jgi:penicillin amidase
VIAVRGRAAVREVVLETSHGPMIGPALEGETEAVALRATWLAPRPIRGLLRAHEARSVEELRVFLADWPALSQHVVAADDSGRIARQLCGAAPRRRKWHGLVPGPGWDVEAGWAEAPVPYEEMPCSVAPPEGLVIAANAAPGGPGPYLGEDWVEGYREARIRQALAARRDWDVSSTRRLQLDTRTLFWPEVRDVVLAAPADCPKVREALAALHDWDGDVRADSEPAALFELFVAEMAVRLARAKAPVG